MRTRGPRARLAPLFLAALAGPTACTTAAAPRRVNEDVRMDAGASSREGVAAACSADGWAAQARLCMTAAPDAGGSANVVDPKGAACADCPGAPRTGRAFDPSLWGVIDCVASCGACTATGPASPFTCVGAALLSPCTSPGGEPLVSPTTGMQCGTCTGGSGCVAPGLGPCGGPILCAAGCGSCEPASTFAP